jgi:NAD-dependent deacetylase
MPYAGVMVSDLDPTIEQAARVLASAQYVVALVGAGISVESGIPPFRGAGGLWTTHGEPPMDGYRRFLDDPTAAWREMLARRGGDDEFARAIREAAPNPAHFALAELESMGMLKHTITQNIDNLHFDAGSLAVTEIHGNRTKVRCVACGGRWRFDEIDLAEIPPVCILCGGVLKGDTVMFGEPIPDAALAECYRQAEAADCMLIAGTSAVVVPAAWLPGIVTEHGGSLVEFNTESTPYTSTAAASVRAPAGEALPKLVEALRALRSRREQP